MDYTPMAISLSSKTLAEPLPVETEQELIQRYLRENDIEARRVLIESNLRYVIKTAFGYKNKGMCINDLIQEGYLGLIEALDRFDPEKKCRLITYASWWIRLRMQRAIEQKGHQINLPINKLDQYRKIKSFQHQFESIHGRQPWNHEIAEELSISEKKVDELLRNEISFQTIHSRDDDHPGLESILEDETLVDMREQIWHNEVGEKLKKILTILTPQEQDVLKHRYNISSGRRGKRMSLRKVGMAMGLSAEGVRHIELKAMQKLRRPAVLSKMETLLAC